METINISGACALLGEYNPFAVARERGVVVKIGMLQQRFPIVAVRIGNEDMCVDWSEAGECDFVLRPACVAAHYEPAIHDRTTNA
jgi:DNA-binding transcriptional LysR family regulator